MISDQQLSERMAAGDQDAFEMLVTRYHGPLLSYTSNQLQDRQKAQDIVQETFIRLIRHLRQHGALEHVRSWLYRVALNQCKDYWKSSAYRSEGLAGEEFPERSDPSAGAEELLERQETSAEIAASLETLPDVQQNIISLRFFHDMKLQEISELLDLPLSTVKTHLYNGLRKLKKLMTVKDSYAPAITARSGGPPGGTRGRSGTEDGRQVKQKESEVYSHGSSFR
ncbi:RNA polymerase sigma-70 factor, ECF subfamily [Paenibacillus uliginis N3/975]|uniref:RNA polymerase sigma-70 factor, ECF subfamily n=1 Tax=Paenibacillus uliginis N3/975 TaxID=1313296 RepID=A0A1X7GI40_9BACL|nr:RNA polymerase sigma factor [Paenibacillus uliginis]SMF70233.1 RNA polymerase sigma-70 factor, ECF subfamily [Paenibacillus uliginis N3/975]